MKKILCALTAVIMLLSCLPVFAADSSEDTVDNSVVKKLYHLGIVNEELYSAYTPDGEMTRAAFADIVVKLLAMDAENITADVTKVFADVTAETKYASSIFQAYSAGVMIGDDKAMFYPEKSITYDEAVKIAVVTLGMYEVAQYKGGYSVGYRAAASDRGLLSGVSGNPEQALNQKSIYRLIDNLIDTKLYIVESYSAGDAKLTKGEATILSAHLELEVYKGIVTGYENTSLQDDLEDIGENSIRVGDRIFNLEYTDGGEFVGCLVTVYHNSDGDVVYIEKDKKNKILTVTSDEIEKTTTIDELHYRPDEGRVKYADFDSEVIYLYNGKKLSSPIVEEIIPAEGQVVLIDNDNDGNYEVVSVESYDVYVVDGTVPADGIIKLKYGMGEISVSDQEDIKVKIFVDGAEATLADLTRWNVIAVKRSKNVVGTVLCEIYATSDSMEGTVTGSDYDGEDYLITIDGGDTYELSPSFIERVEEGAEDSSYPMFDKQIVFYLDKFGKIAAINSTASAKNYGYVLRCYYDFENDKSYVKLFNKNEEFITYPVSDKLKVNDEKVETQDLPEVMKASTSDGTVYQLIVYTLNSENEITKIRLAQDKRNEAYYVSDDDEFVLHCSTVINPSTGNYYGIRFYKYLAVDYPFYFLEGTTLNFQIPKDKEREQDFKVVTKLASTDVSLSGPVSVYDAGLGGQIGAVVSSVQDDTNFGMPAIVSKVIPCVDDDGEACKQIVFFDGTSIYAKEDSIKFAVPERSDNSEKLNWSSRVDYSKYGLDDLEKGDVVEYTKINEYVNTMRYIVKREDIGLSRVNAGYALAKNGNMVCTAYSVSDNKRSAIVKYTDYENTEKHQSMFVNGTVYKIDKETGETTYSSTADIEKGDTLLLNSFWWSAKMIIIFK